MTSGKGFRSIFGGAAIVLVVMLAALESAADWDLYVAGGIGISAANFDTDGIAVQGATTIFLGGQDDDSSPLVDGAFGVEIPLEELVPREWTMDVRLPDWPIRFEVEAAGLREYELRTFAGTETFFSEVEVNSTFFFNIWQELPVVDAYKPFQYLLGLGRQPRVRQILEPASFFAGAGVGFADMEITGTSNVIAGSEDTLEFAWNAGAGINYALTDRVDLAFGYRFVGLPDVDVPLETAAGVPFGTDLEFENEVHEFRVQVQVEVWSFLSPWR